MSERSSCELPEGGPQSLVQLSSQRQRHPNDSEQNVYLPLTTFLDQPISQESAAGNEVRVTNVSTDNSGRERLQRTLDFPEEPPPAYTDLFPDGFQVINDIQEMASADIVTFPILPSSSNNDNIANITSSVADSGQTEMQRNRTIPIQNHNSLESSQLAQEPQVIRSDPTPSRCISATVSAMCSSGGFNITDDILNAQQYQEAANDKSSEDISASNDAPDNTNIRPVDTLAIEQ